jgi:flagellar biosynthesis protein FlhF
MNVVRFLARDPGEAIAQIGSRLGAEAVVLSVRQVPAGGLGRLWGKPLLEVRAGLADHTPADQLAAAPCGRKASHALLPFGAPAARGGSAAAPSKTTGTKAPDLGFTQEESQSGADPGPPGLGGRWRSGRVLREMGLQPLLVEKVLEGVRARYGEEPPASLAEELTLARAVLASFWRPAPEPPDGSPAIHALIGPPGSGKTTVLCKWLAKSVLDDRRLARAWRLDSRAAHFAGLLDFYGEILGVRVEREWTGVQALAGCDEAFVDLPGVNPLDRSALEQLQAQLVGLAGAQVHLVLNAAYEVSVLLAQARAFDDWPVSDLIFTHLDEEKRPGKLWNLVLGTKFTVRFLSGGQNVPGDFSVARPDLLICP